MVVRESARPRRQHPGHLRPGRLPAAGLAGRAGLGARHHRRPRPARPPQRACRPCPAPGYDGAGTGIHIPVRQPPGGQDPVSIPAPATPCSGRCAARGERGFALPTGRWRALQHVTVSPGKTGGIARAALVLTHCEHGYIT